MLSLRYKPKPKRNFFLGHPVDELDKLDELDRLEVGVSLMGGGWVGLGERKKNNALLNFFFNF